MQKNPKVWGPRCLYGIGMAVTFLLIFLSRNVKLVEPDFFMHLRVGQWIWENQKVPYTDVFSHIVQGHEWLDHEWLFQVIIYGLYKLTGWTGLAMARNLLLTLAFVTVWRTCRLFGIPQWGALAFALASGGLTIGSLEMRPQVFTYLFLPLGLHIIYRYLSGRKGPLWLLPPMVLIWANMHGAFVTIFLAAGVIVAGEVGKLLLAGRGLVLGPVQPMERLVKLIAALGVSAIATLANPFGWELWLFPFKVIQHDVFFEMIFEWMPPDFPFFMPFWIVLLVLAIIVVPIWRRVDLTHLLLLVVWSYLSLQARRNIALFAFAGVPLFGRMFYQFMDYLGEQPWGRWLRGARAPAAGTALVAALAGWETWQITEIFRLNALHEWGVGFHSDVPVKTADFILREKPVGKMYNEYNVGGYLINRLYPDYLVYQDGRVDVYGADGFIAYKMVESGGPAWREAVRKHDLNFMVLTYGGTGNSTSLIKSLDEARDFSLVHFDDNCLVYAKNDGPNKELASRLGYHFLKPGQLPENTLKSKDAMTSALPELDRKIAEDPDCQVALRFKAFCLANLGRYEEAGKVMARLLELVPDKSFIRVLKARMALGQKNHDLALAELRAALDENPRNTEALTLLGRTLETREDLMGARDAYSKAVAISPYSPDILKDRARIASRLGNDQDSIRYWERSVELNPFDVESLNDLGSLYQRTGDYARAISLLRRASLVAPANAGPEYNLACVYAKLGEYPRAFERLKAALDKGGETIRLVAIQDKDLDALKKMKEFGELTDKERPALSPKSKQTTSTQALGRTAE